MKEIAKKLTHVIHAFEENFSNPEEWKTNAFIAILFFFITFVFLLTDLLVSLTLSL